MIKIKYATNPRLTAFMENRLKNAFDNMIDETALSLDMTEIEPLIDKTFIQNQFDIVNALEPVAKSLSKINALSNKTLAHTNSIVSDSEYQYNRPDDINAAYFSEVTHQIGRTTSYSECPKPTIADPKQAFDFLINKLRQTIIKRTISATSKVILTDENGDNISYPSYTGSLMYLEITPRQWSIESEDKLIKYATTPLNLQQHPDPKSFEKLYKTIIECQKQLMIKYDELSRVDQIVCNIVKSKDKPTAKTQKLCDLNIIAAADIQEYYLAERNKSIAENIDSSAHKKQTLDIPKFKPIRLTKGDD